MKVTVRTLDSQNHEIEIENEEITVKEFKELIQPEVKVDVDKQRIIFRGKVLQNDKPLKEYGVDGLVVHLVQQAPPASTRTSSHPPSTTAPSASRGAHPANVYIGAISNASDDLNGVAQNLVDNLISQFGAGNVTASQRGNSLNVNINVGYNSQDGSDVRNRIGTARRFLSHAEHLIQHIEEARPSNQPSCAVHAVTTSGCSHSHHHHHHHHHHNHGHVHEHAHSHVNTGSSSNDSSVTSGETTATSQKEEEMETDKEEDSNEVTIEDVPDESNTNRQESRQDRSSAETQSQQDDTSPSALGNVYSQFLHLYRHLLPSLRRYEYLLHHPQAPDRSPGDDNLPDQLAEIFHDLSHAFHAMSDLSVNLSAPSPQRLMCFPSLSPMMFPMPFQGGFLPQPSGSMGASTTFGRTSTSGSTSQSGPRPVAVAAISTVVQIPASGLPPGITHNASSRPTPEGATASEMTSQLPSNTPSSATPSVSQPPPPLFNPFSTQSRGPFSMNIGRGTFANRPGVTANTIRINMSHPRPTTNLNSQSTDRPRTPPGLQNFMQNVMQSFSGGNHSARASTSAASSMSSGASRATSTFQNASWSTATQVTPVTNQPNSVTASTATQRRTLHHPHPHHHHHNHDGSIIHPDNLLPCGSFHFGPTFHQGGESSTAMQRARAESATASPNATSETNSTTTNEIHSTTSNASTSSQTNVTGGAPPNVDISDMLSGIFQNFTNTNEHPAEVSVRIETDDGDIEMGSSGNDLESNIFQSVQQSVMQMFGGMPHGASSGPSGDGEGGTTRGNERQTLRDFMRQNFGLSAETNDTFIADVIDVMVDNLSMADLISLFLGSSSEPWNRMHNPLRQLVEKHFNENRPMTEENIDEVVARMATALSEVNGEAEANVEVQPDVDLKATLTKIDKKLMKKLLRLLMAPGTNFAAGISSWYKEYCAWNFGVLDLVVTGGADRYLAALMESDSVQQLFQDITPSLRQLTLQTITSRIRSSIVGTNITQSEINDSVVRLSQRVVSRENPCKEETGSAAKRAKKSEQVDVELMWEEKYGANDISSDSDVDGDSPPPGDDWHNHMPNDWVLLINRDNERQRAMPPQRPYSDAYLSGLPPKRRQMLAQHPPEADRLDVNSTLRNSIKKCGVKRKAETGSNDLEKDIDNSELQAMFEATFRHDARQRLQHDGDYTPQQFPNSEEYYMKEQK